MKEIDDFSKRDLDFGCVLEFGFQKNSATGLAGIVLQRMLTPASFHSHQIDLTLGTLAGEGFGIQTPTEAFQSGKVVMKENAIQIRNIDPQTGTISAFS